LINYLISYLFRSWHGSLLCQRASGY
jgi:hypothetical protein